MSKNIIFLTIGAGIGFAAGWFACNKKNEGVVEKEIENMSEYFADKFERFKKEFYEEQEVSEPKKIDVDINKPRTEKEDLVDYQGIIKKLNYNQFSTKTNKPVEDKEPGLTLDTSNPRIISADEWLDNNGYEKVVLSYFEDDEVLMTATDEVLDNGIMIVGEENLQEFGINEEEEDTIYVRNDLMGCDYEVVLEEGSYADYIASEV